MIATDDSWAYARMVQHLLATGRYQLDAWSAANMPTQIYWAAGLSRIFGYSLSLLRCSTLILLVVGLFSFYALLREFRFTQKSASIFTVALLASPLILMLSFTFMSDVQFLSWLLLALWLYIRGLRRHSVKNMFMGSLATGCAIGTRQFGIALIGALILSYLLTGRYRRPAPRLLAAGIAVPLVAAMGQLYIGFAAPNITQAVRLSDQHKLLHQPAMVLLQELFWRCALTLQYTGMAMLPMLPIATYTSRSNGEGPSRRNIVAIVMALSAALIVAALVISSPLSARSVSLHHGVWDPLQLHWLLHTQMDRARPIMYFLDLAGVVGGAVLAATCFRKIRPLWASERLSPELILLIGTAVGLFLLHLIYVQFNDTYLAAFSPFGLLAFAKGEQEDAGNTAALAWSAAISLTLIAAISFYVRAEDAALNAVWKASDALVQSGVRPEDIAAPLAWEEYHGAFDDWVAAGAPGFKAPTPYPPGDHDWFHEPFNDWMTARDNNAGYRAGLFANRPPPGWAPIAVFGYRNASFQRRFGWALKRVPPR